MIKVQGVQTMLINGLKKPSPPHRQVDVEDVGKIGLHQAGRVIYVSRKVLYSHKITLFHISGSERNPIDNAEAKTSMRNHVG